MSTAKLFVSNLFSEIGALLQKKSTKLVNILTDIENLDFELRLIDEDEEKQKLDFYNKNKEEYDLLERQRREIENEKMRVIQEANEKIENLRNELKEKLAKYKESREQAVVAINESANEVRILKNDRDQVCEDGFLLINASLAILFKRCDRAVKLLHSHGVDKDSLYNNVKKHEKKTVFRKRINVLNSVNPNIGADGSQITDVDYVFNIKTSKQILDEQYYQEYIFPDELFEKMREEYKIEFTKLNKEFGKHLSIKDFDLYIKDYNLKISNYENDLKQIQYISEILSKIRDCIKNIKDLEGISSDAGSHSNEIKPQKKIKNLLNTMKELMKQINIKPDEFHIKRMENEEKFKEYTTNIKNLKLKIDRLEKAKKIIDYHIRLQKEHISMKF